MCCHRERNWARSNADLGHERDGSLEIGRRFGDRCSGSNRKAAPRAAWCGMVGAPFRDDPADGNTASTSQHTRPPEPKVGRDNPSEGPEAFCTIGTQVDRR